MKATFFGFASVALFALTNLVIASPTPESALVEKRQDYDSIPTIITAAIADAKVVDAKYNSTCAGSCSTTDVSSWSSEMAQVCYTAIDKCKKIPSGTKWDKGDCTGLVVELLLEIQFTLKFLLGKCGLLGLLTGVLSLVSVLIVAINALLVELVIFVDGLLDAVSALLISIVGSLGCLLCELGCIL